MSLNFRKYDNQFSTSKTTFSTSDSTSEILICILKLTVEFTTKLQITNSHQFNDLTDEQSISADNQSDYTDLSNHLIDTSKQSLKKTSTCSVSADFQSEHIIQRKQTRIQSDQQAINVIMKEFVKFNFNLFFQSFFIMIDHAHQSHH